MISIHAAKAHLSSLVEEAAHGEKIVIAKAGRPVARLVALEKPAFGRPLDELKGRIHASPDFDASLLFRCPCGLRNRTVTLLLDTHVWTRVVKTLSGETARPAVSAASI